jgi:hypothetical protein
VKVVCVSDTHGLHGGIKIEGDLLLHAGDWSKGRGNKPETLEFLNWMKNQRFKHKILVPGNHDFVAQNHLGWLRQECENFGVTLLLDQQTTVNGLKIWGSPWQPWFFDWAFNLDRGPALKAKWDLIPPDTDILVTHGPPHGILDEVKTYQPWPKGWTTKDVGCEELLLKVKEVKPRLHLFGHIHQGYGQHHNGNTLFVNASVTSENYELFNDPVRLNL